MHGRLSLVAPITLVATIFLASCSSGDVAADNGAMMVGEQGTTLLVGAKDVQIMMSGNAWPAGDPPITGVIAVLVAIENTGDRPLHVRYDQFRLLDGSGQRTSPIPPVALESEGERPRITYAFQPQGFAVASYLGAEYVGLPRSERDLRPNATYWGGQAPLMTRSGLPVAAMIPRALPEGVLAAGGGITGFLYFKNDTPSVGRLDLQVALVEAEAGTRLGTLMATLPGIPSNGDTQIADLF